ncbi:disease resistance protein RPV1-like [Syzygium oleosum]|uniref:disease resistance protein RPV1-like n=1 Tax=Syzygium oleosum TaxID=219896 RepID=UPI0024BA22D8|nr:disease resistance protein RPV1-like [Syzygium oleosum]
MEVKAESIMAESASRGGKKGEDGPKPRPRSWPRPRPRSRVMAIEDISSGTNRKKSEDEPARLDQRNWQSGEDGPARLNQDMVKLLADSSTAEYASTKGERVEDELNQDMMKSEVKSVYDVVLSFTGTDVGSDIANRLYDCLVADRIRVFRYDGTLRTPTEELRSSVYSSKICVPIFSRNYAGSSWCLDALALMVEHTSTSGGKKEILPVFYDVDRNLLEKKSLDTKDLNKQRRKWGDEKVEQWKKALGEAGKVEGWDLSSYKGVGQEGLINIIVREISLKLKIEHKHVFEDLFTGADPVLSSMTSELQDSQKSEIMRLLELEVNDVRIVGIHGRDGIGKTALAKIVYDQISQRFDACSFLAEIEETTQQPGAVLYLQTKLIFDMLKREYEVISSFKGVRFLKEIFRNMKVLIVLDDVKSRSRLKMFVGAELDWFGSGSRIIVTSKKRSVLQGFVARGLAHTYNVNPMDDNLAFNFLWQCAAIGKSDELRSYVKIAIQIVKAAKGLPLLLKVFGSFLHDKGLEEWIKFEDLIQKCQEDYQKILSIIYEALDQKQKQMYLDIACFPPDVDYRIASYMTHGYYGPNKEIRVLRRMSLIKMEENRIGMHSMLRCLAREIIRKGFHDPGTVVGLHLPAIAQDTNKGKKGTDHLNTEEAGFEIPSNTTFLSLGRANIGGQFADTLLNVRWLHWPTCPQDAIRIHLEKNENLVILDLSWSKVTGSWRGWKRIKMERLKVLNLTGSADLLVTPSFSCCPNLERLILEKCSRLVHLDPSINDLKRLVTLNLKFCSELSMLPVEMDGMNALKELLIDGTSIRQLPASIGKLVQLQILGATNCSSLVHVPGSICDQTLSLSVLALDDAKILELPESLGNLWQLRRLSLRDCRGLGKLPESIGKLRFSLVELDISGTGISKLPDSTKNLRNLTVLKMDSCFVREFPCDIAKLFYLEEVHASWCRSLEGVIPSNISELCHLRELRLRGTRISSLPPEIQFMSSLQTLDLLHCDILKKLPPLPSNLINLYVNHCLKQKM